MKKRNIMIAIIIIILIIISIIGIRELKKYETVTAIITSIDGKCVYAADEYINNYVFSIENSIIIDKNGKIVKTSEIKRGNRIEIVYKRGKYKTDNYVDDVKIVKVLEENTEVSDSFKRSHYNSTYYVDISISEISNKGITFTIIDLNDLPFEYKGNYRILKKFNADKYKGKNSENYASEVITMGSGMEYTWKELPKISKLPSKDTVEEVIIDKLENISEDDRKSVMGIRADWVKIYGELEERRI